ncbi:MULTISPECIES: Crp/Fnr family transcriptional regulator [unclassified Dehalobacter]|uniref:Crp/Fnr family transcriptional regulator n=1 Tax=unclassified Dehalobacter TaxID=2635733 RepID=UPI000E6B8061|nr:MULTISPECIES: Crp/Fnr family transcriptional regulator [unclassified Dehalobacter]RJE47232.1 hypothetical protein A7K50_04485 [Dehalobacter sp. MCB1]TCX53522.1 hypothetical protein C1I36_01895 [Dehalobacter sp. 14DCB1]TCX54907.1 hypothetical protein C1I38_04295 [Dehalobacter sp. 12DCB1]
MNVMNSKVHFCLKNIPAFDSLDQRIRDKMCSFASKRLYKVDEYIFKQDEAADTILILMYGVLKLFRVNECGTETILDYVSPGEIVGYDTFFQQNVYNYTSCVAVIESRICCIDRANFEKLLMDEPTLMQTTLSKMSNYLANLNQNILGNKIMHAKEKLKSTFLSLGQDHGVEIEGGIRIDIKLTQQEIADLIGISRSVACQLINELVDEGFIDRKGKTYIIRKEHLCPNLFIMSKWKEC